MNHPKILAFMQNAWFPEETKREHVERYKTDQEFHRRLLARTMSGSRLLQAFGPDVFNRIWWDNVASAHTESPDGIAPIDMDHVETVIEKFGPHLIITFGKMAEQAIDSSILAASVDYMCCHHPNARGKTAGDLGQFAVEVESWCNDWRIKEPLLRGNYAAFRAQIQPEIDKKLPPKTEWESGYYE